MDFLFEKTLEMLTVEREREGGRERERKRERKREMEKERERERDGEKERKRETCVHGQISSLRAWNSNQLDPEYPKSFKISRRNEEFN
jgi:ribosomal protein S8E